MTIQEALADPVGLLEEVGALLYGNFTLSSGKSSSYYFDSKPLTLNPEGAHIVGTYIFDKLRQSDVRAVGGMALGAVPIVEAVTLISYINNHPLPGFFVRKNAKEHGTARIIEGNLPKDKSHPVAIIDDVVTGGKTILQAIEAVKAEGNPITEVMCILDRGEGGREVLKQRGYDLKAMFITVSKQEGEVEIRFNP